MPFGYSHAIPSQSPLRDAMICSVDNIMIDPIHWLTLSVSNLLQKLYGLLDILSVVQCSKSLDIFKYKQFRMVVINVMQYMIDDFATRIVQSFLISRYGEGLTREASHTDIHIFLQNTVIP